MADESETTYYFPTDEVMDEIDSMLREAKEDYDRAREEGWVPQGFYVDGVSVQVVTKHNE